jgi:hypothetical protein
MTPAPFLANLGGAIQTYGRTVRREQGGRVPIPTKTALTEAVSLAREIVACSGKQSGPLPSSPFCRELWSPVRVTRATEVIAYRVCE